MLTARELLKLSEKLDTAGDNEKKKIQILKVYLEGNGTELSVEKITEAALKKLLKKLAPGKTTYEVLLDFLKENKVYGGKYVEKLKAWLGIKKVPNRNIIDDLNIE